jgi:hypothetical protein
MNKTIKQAGFGAVEVILFIAVLGLAGFVGYRVYDQNKTDKAAETAQTETPIEKAEDLDAEVTELNSQDIDEKLDTSEIDENLE